MNVFLVIIDTLRYDVFHSQMPFISKLKDDPHVLNFDNAFTVGTSTPFAFPGILGSVYSFVEKTRGIEKVPITLAEIFKDKGFRTFGNGGGNYNIADIYGYGRGFDEYFPRVVKSQNKLIRKLKDAIKSHKQLFDTLLRIEKGVVLFKCFFDFLIEKQLIFPFYRIMESLMDFLNAHRENNFVFLNVMDVHGPYTGILKMSFFDKLTYYKFYKLISYSNYNKAAEMAEIYKNLYIMSARLVDSQLNNLFLWLDQKNMLKNSLIIITADHGNEFAEHGQVDHLPKPFEELIHVPLIIYVGWEIFSKDDKIKASEKLVSLIDLAPSIVEYVFNLRVDSFMGFNTLFSDKTRDYVYSEGWRNVKTGGHDPLKKGVHNFAFRTSYWKYMFYEGKELFFDLIKDPEEKDPQEVPDNIKERIDEFKNNLNKLTLKYKISKFKKEVRA